MRPHSLAVTWFFLINSWGTERDIMSVSAARELSYYPPLRPAERLSLLWKQDQIPWTPENMSPILLPQIFPDDCFTIGESSAVSVIEETSSINTNTAENKFISDTISRVRTRITNRMGLAHSCFRRSMNELSHACHFATKSAKNNSIGHLLCRSTVGKGCQSCITAFHKTLRNPNSNSRVPLRNPNSDSRVPSSPSLPADFPLDDHERRQLISKADALLNNVIDALDDPSLWQKINEQDGVKIWKTHTDIKNLENIKNANTCSSSSGDSVIIRSEAIMQASPCDVYNLFSDDERVREYNDNCRELKDVAHLTDNAKINWSATGKFGPFSARDFVTLVTFRHMGPGNGYVSLAVNVEHPDLVPVKKGYVRSQIQLAATFMRPVEGRPDLTRFVQVTQVGELGGVADSALAKRIKRNLEEKAPIEFMKKFNDVVKSTGSSTSACNGSLI